MPGQTVPLSPWASPVSCGGEIPGMAESTSAMAINIAFETCILNISAGTRASVQVCASVQVFESIYVC